MRVAGRLASEVLDFITPHVKPGVTTGELDRLCHDYMVNVQGTVPAPLNYAPPGYRPYPEVDLHLGQPPGLPRHPGRQGAEARRHRQHRRHRHQGRLARRHQPHVLRRASPRSRPGACASRPTSACGTASTQVRPGATLGDIGHAIQRHAESQRLLRRARVLRPRHRRAGSTRSRRSCTTAGPARGSSCAPGMTFTDRADDQRRPARHPPAGRRLDHRHQATTACRRSGSTPCWSPRPATRCSRCPPAARRRRRSSSRRLTGCGAAAPLAPQSLPRRPAHAPTPGGELRAACSAARADARPALRTAPTQSWASAARAARGHRSDAHRALWRDCAAAGRRGAGRRRRLRPRRAVPALRRRRAGAAAADGSPRPRRPARRSSASSAPAGTSAWRSATACAPSPNACAEAQPGRHRP